MTSLSQRRYDIDWLRVLGVLLLVPFHAALIFVLDPRSIMYIKDTVNSQLLGRLAGSEQLAYEYALVQYRSLDDLSMVRKLESAPPTMTVPLPSAYVSLRDEYMHDLGVGTTHEMRSVVTGIFLPSWQFREYTLAEKVNLWRGKVYSRSREFSLWDTMLATDLSRQVTELDVPVYFFHGKYDYTCAYPLAIEYFEELKSSVKGFYTFENSAHSPVFEEPEKALTILMNDVLNGTNTFADKK